VEKYIELLGVLRDQRVEISFSYGIWREERERKGGGGGGGRGDRKRDVT
jgi:hypothetical protein